MGVPFGRSSEFAPVDLDARDAEGKLIIPKRAHIRLAGHQTLNGIRILRRGYSFTDGMDIRAGRLDSGLFFICFQRDPARQFVPMQRNLARDNLNEYIKQTGSGIYAIAPGVQAGGYWGQRLFEG